MHVLFNNTLFYFHINRLNNQTSWLGSHMYLGPRAAMIDKSSSMSKLQQSHDQSSSWITFLLSLPIQRSLLYNVAPWGKKGYQLE